jgi:hypothetical protein
MVQQVPPDYKEKEVDPVKEDPSLAKLTLSELIVNVVLKLEEFQVATRNSQQQPTIETYKAQKTEVEGKFKQLCMELDKREVRKNK